MGLTTPQQEASQRYQKQGIRLSNPAMVLPNARCIFFKADIKANLLDHLLHHLFNKNFGSRANTTLTRPGTPIDIHNGTRTTLTRVKANQRPLEQGPHRHNRQVPDKNPRSIHIPPIPIVYLNRLRLRHPPQTVLPKRCVPTPEHKTYHIIQAHLVRFISQPLLTKNFLPRSTLR